MELQSVEKMPVIIKNKNPGNSPFVPQRMLMASPILINNNSLLLNRNNVLVIIFYYQQLYYNFNIMLIHMINNISITYVINGGYYKTE